MKVLIDGRLDKIGKNALESATSYCPYQTVVYKELL